jgi:hypothetical protein
MYQIEYETTERPIYIFERDELGTVGIFFIQPIDGLFEMYGITRQKLADMIVAVVQPIAKYRGQTVFHHEDEVSC